MALYEAVEMSIINPQQVSGADADQIVSAFEALMRAEDEADESDDDDAVEDARDELNVAVLGRIDAEEKVDDVKQAVETLVANREEGAGEETEVLVNRTDSKEVVKLEGVEQARERTLLADFLWNRVLFSQCKLAIVSIYFI